MKKLIIIFFTLLSACAGTPFRWDDARRIEQGMNKQQVTSILGSPNRVASMPNESTRYVWVWINTLAGNSQTLSIDFDRNGRVIKAPPIPDEFQD